jgi:hypothetical protein
MNPKIQGKGDNEEVQSREFNIKDDVYLLKRLCRCKHESDYQIGSRGIDLFVVGLYLVKLVKLHPNVTIGSNIIASYLECLFFD